MANRPAPALTPREGDQARVPRSPSVQPGPAQRTWIVLLAADGLSNTAIVELTRVSWPTVIGWRERYQARGLAGLADEHRSGRPRHADHRRIVAATLRPSPKKHSVAYWSCRLLGRHLKIGDATVGRAWRGYGVQPWWMESCRFSADLELVGLRTFSTAQKLHRVATRYTPKEGFDALCLLDTALKRRVPADTCDSA